MRAQAFVFVSGQGQVLGGPVCIKSLLSLLFGPVIQSPISTKPWTYGVNPGLVLTGP